MEDIGGNTHKKGNSKMFEFSFGSYLDAIHTYVFVHLLANKSRWMKMIQVSYLFFLYLRKKTGETDLFN